MDYFRYLNARGFETARRDAATWKRALGTVAVYDAVVCEFIAHAEAETEVVRWAKSGWPHIPVVAITKVGDMDASMAASRAGVDAFVDEEDWGGLARELTARIERSEAARERRVAPVSTGNAQNSGREPEPRRPHLDVGLKMAELMRAPTMDRAEVKKELARVRAVSRHDDNAALLIGEKELTKVRVAPPEELAEALSRFGEEGGPSEAFVLDALAKQRGSEKALLLAQSLSSTSRFSPRVRGACARAYFEAGLVKEADAILAAIDDPDARVLAADIAKRAGRDERAFDELGRAQATRLETLGAEERVRRWRNALFSALPGPRVGSTVDVDFCGTRWTILLDGEPLLGRAEAAIVVASPLVSRRHLVIRAGDEAPTVEDLGSRHGTFSDGKRIEGRMPISAGLPLMLGGSIPCMVRPAKAPESDAPAAVVEVGVGAISSLSDRPCASRRGDSVSRRRDSSSSTSTATAAWLALTTCPERSCSTSALRSPRASAHRLSSRISK